MVAFTQRRERGEQESTADLVVTERRVHEPVMVDEVLDFLDPRPGDVMADLTVGAGGHASRLLERVGSLGRVIGVDRDNAILEIARSVLASHGERAQVVRGVSQDLRAILDGVGIEQLDGVLLDLGVSSMQLDRGERGFSFQSSGPLDMRMNKDKGATALDLIKESDAATLERIFREYGEEPHARLIAGRLANLARRRPPRTTGELAAFIESLVPQKAGRRRIHPATRVFQALRIAVNDELGVLQRTLPVVEGCLAPGGRLVVLSYHSLEDRIVKNFIRDQHRAGSLQKLTDKPVSPDAEEVRRNSRARSAKLRAARKLAPEEAA